jgi:hypothetical protein
LSETYIGPVLVVHFRQSISGHIHHYSIFSKLLSDVVIILKVSDVDVFCIHTNIDMIWYDFEYPERTTDHWQATGNLYHLLLRVECILSFSHCVVCSFWIYTDSDYPFGIFKLFYKSIEIISERKSKLYESGIIVWSNCRYCTVYSCSISIKFGSHICILTTTVPYDLDICRTNISPMQYSVIISTIYYCSTSSKVLRSPPWLGWPFWNICVTNDHAFVPLVVSNFRSFPHSWIITGSTDICFTQIVAISALQIYRLLKS